MATKAPTIRETIRLREQTKLSVRQIAKQLNISGGTARKIIHIARSKILSVDELNKLDDDEVRKLFHRTRSVQVEKRIPNWPFIHRLMRQSLQTLIQLWDEYRAEDPLTAYSYSQFTYYYRLFSEKLNPAMRQVHIAGEICFVDFAGKTLSWSDPQTGEKNDVEIFVGVLGSSNYTFVMAVPSQKTEHFISAHNAMLAFFGGVPEAIVPDNLKAAVIKPGRNGLLNRSYYEFSKHYQCAIVPARVRKAQDKSLAELAVLFITRWITIPLRRRKFFSIEEINQAISEKLILFNQRKFKRLPYSRQSLFEEVERPKLKPLPALPFEYAEWVSEQKVGADYHIYVKGHAYSVPYTLIAEMVEARVTTDKVQLIHKNKVVATHQRSFIIGDHTTNSRHRPLNHQRYAQQTLEDFMVWASKVGKATEMVVLAQFKGKSDFSIVARRACNQLKDLSRYYGAKKLEKASQRAVDIASLTVKTVRSILQMKMHEADFEMTGQIELPLHENVRGPDYYSQGGVQ